MSPPKSLIALSMHKAGSSITNSILTDIAQARGYEVDIVANKASASTVREEEYFIAYQAQMKPQGVYYGMARGPYVQKLPVIATMRAIVQLRDPRDCITSAYFSFGGSHRLSDQPEKRKVMLQRREKISAMDIDDYALGIAPQYLRRMQILARMIEEHDDVLVLRYEEMVCDTELWLGRISEFLDQPVTEALRARLGSKLNFSVATEDTSKHKRQVQPGDHARKLRPETIAELNRTLAAVMTPLDYAI